MPLGLAAHLRSISATPGTPAPVRPQSSASLLPALSAEQQRLVDAVASGENVIVDATVGSGKTTAIQALCEAQDPDRQVLYLTYSKLLKLDAQRRVRQAKVQNYHGIVYPSLLRAGIKAGISESIKRFNQSFVSLSADFPRYDLLVVDEYQDINEEYATLLSNIKSLNPLMQTVMVGDMAQKVRADTTLDVQGFAQGFCEQPVHVPFTQSFRMGPQLGELLSKAWNKPVVGVNANQWVREMDYDEAVELMLTRQPGDILCLGKRNGQMVAALNDLEKRAPGTFNKNTVYASIQDGDTRVSYGSDTAVFTTFDASKGLERPLSFVFDFHEEYWNMRNRFPDAEPEILRNIFLVAASRGKEGVVFVRSHPAGGRYRSMKAGLTLMSNGMAAGHDIGAIPIHRFTTLNAKARPVYEQPFQPSSCFDFRYAENVESCFELLETTRLDDGQGQAIEIERSDGLIDLSPVVGSYQEALYFDNYSPQDAFAGLDSALAQEMLAEVMDDDSDPWRNALRLTAATTEQARYAEQVGGGIPEEVERQLIDRLATQLPRDCVIQLPLELQGTALQSRSEATTISFKGVADALHQGRIFELKFVTELSHAMFLQLALYLVMSDVEEGVLWNTRTDERWLVTVPDRQRFMNAVVLCVSKQSYRVFEAAA